MRTLLTSLAIWVLIAIAPLAAAAYQTSSPTAVEQDARLPAPTAEQQRSLQKIIAELFHPEQAETREAQLKLAGKLLEAVKTNEDPASQFMLLQQSRNLASEGWDFPLACHIVDRMAKSYAIDPHAIKLKLLDDANIPTREAETLKSLIQTALASASQAVDDGEFATAEKLGQVAIKSARRLRDGKLVREIVDFNKAIGARVDQQRAGIAAVARLKTAADDPETNETAGRYLCLLKGDWNQGLPLLAKSADTELKQLAAQDLAAPQSAKDQKALGDAWWERAEGEQAPWKKGALARAKYWYTQADPHLTGLARAAVDKRLKDLAEIESVAQEPPQVSTSGTSAAGKVIDLLPLVDPTKHTVSGEWKTDGKVLGIVPDTDSNFSRIRIPIAPQGSYELAIEFTRNGGGYLTITLPLGNRATTLMPGWGNGTVIDKFKKWRATENPTWTDVAPGLKLKQKIVVRVEFQADQVAIRVDLNEKTIIKWSGPIDGLQQNEHSDIPLPVSLALGSHHGGAVFHRVQLKMLSGKAVPLTENK